MNNTTTNKLRIAIEGCCHGELDNIYQSLNNTTVKIGMPLPDLLLICGDFQSIRNKYDLKCISIPPKYQKLGDFADYYTGKKQAPLLTVFIGGNHEASNYLDEVKYGGWVAPNIYFLGHSGVIWHKGVRISGISGIWNPSDFNKPRNEILPYKEQGFVRSAYHVRKMDFFKQYLIRQPVSAMVSHDWPKDIVHHGNVKWLLKNKPFFKKDIETGRLGSEVNKVLLNKLRPSHWFSAHLHVRFTAVVEHKPKTTNKRKNSLDVESDAKKLRIATNKDEIEISLSSDDESGTDVPELPVVGYINVTNEIELDLDSSEAESEDEIPTYEKETDEPDVKKSQTPVKVVNNPTFEPLVSKNSSPTEISSTEFLALDKCLPKRKFLELKHIPITSTEHPSFFNDKLYHDREFIAITKVVQNSFMKTEFYQRLHKFEQIFDLDEDVKIGLEREIDLELSKLNAIDDAEFEISPTEFVITAPVDATELKGYSNPQTDAFERKFGL